jgi:hypothetical protein
MPGGTLKLIKMADIQDVLDVTFNELSSEHQLLLKEVVEQFQQKCLMSFSKNRSGVPFLKTDMPRVLLPGEDHVWFKDRWMVASLCDE